MSCKICELIQANGDDDMCFTCAPTKAILFRIIPATVEIYGKIDSQ